MVFSSIQFDPNFLSPNNEQVVEQETSEPATNLGFSSLKDTIAGSFKKLLFSSDNVRDFNLFCSDDFFLLTLLVLLIVEITNRSKYTKNQLVPAQPLSSICIWSKSSHH